MNVAVLTTGTSIKEFVDGIGRVHAITLVAIMLRNFCSQFNVSKNMSQSQIEDYACDLVLDYYDRRDTIAWKFEEYAIFFDRAAKGEFRKPNGDSFIFDRIDRDVIESIFEVYLQERTAARWKIEDDAEAKKRAGDPPPPPRTSSTEFEFDARGVGHLKKPTIWDLRRSGENTDASINDLERKYGH